MKPKTLLKIVTFLLQIFPGIVFCQIVKTPQLVVQGVQSFFYPLSTTIPSGPVVVESSTPTCNFTSSINRLYRPPFCGNPKIISCNNRQICIWDVRTKTLVKQLDNIESVTRFATNSDGSKLLTAGEDSVARLWDLLNGQLIRSFPESKGHVALSADGEDMFLDFKRSDGKKGETARIVQSENGNILFDLDIIGDSIDYAYFSEKPGIIALSYGSGNLVLWDYKQHRKLYEYKFDPPIPYSRIPTRAFFSANSSFLVVTGYVNDINQTQIWDIEKGRLCRTVKFLSYGVTRTPVDSELVLYNDSEIMKTNIDARVADQFYHLPKDTSIHHSDPIVSAELMAGRDVMMLTEKGRIIEVNYKTWQKSSESKLDIKSWADLQKVNFTIDDSYLFLHVYNFFDGSESLLLNWDTGMGRGIGSSFYVNKVKNYYCGKNESRLLTKATYESDLWNLTTGRRIAVFQGIPMQVALSNDFQTIIDRDGNCFDVNTETNFRRLKFKDSLRSITFSPDKKIVFIRYENDQMQIFHLDRDTALFSFTAPPAQYLISSKKRGLQNLDKSFAHVGDYDRNEYRVNDFENDIAFSPNGRLIAVSRSHDVNLYTYTGKLVRTILLKDSDASAVVSSLRFSPSSDRILVGFQYGTVFEIDTLGNELSRDSLLPERGIYTENDEIKRTGYFKDGINFYSLAANGVLHTRVLRDTALKRIKADHKIVNDLVFDQTSSGQKDVNFVNDCYLSNDSTMLVTCGLDHIVNIWDCKTGTESKYNLGAIITHASLSPKNQFLFASTDDGATVVFDLRTKTQQCQLFTFHNGDYYILDPSYQFDTNDPEFMKEISWVFPNKPFSSLPPEIFFRDYFRPGVLAKSFRPQAPETKPRSFSSLNTVTPAISRMSVKPQPNGLLTVSVNLRVGFENCTMDTTNQNQTCGIYDLRLFRNGQLIDEFPSRAKEFTENRDSNTNLYQSVNLNDWRTRMRILPNNNLFSTDIDFTNIKVRFDNSLDSGTFSAYAFNEDRVRSETKTVKYSHLSTIIVKPKIYVIAIGVSETQNGMNLATPAYDAIDFESKIPQLMQGRYNRVIPIKLVSSADSNFAKEILATKANIEYLLAYLSNKKALFNNGTVSPALIKMLDTIPKLNPQDDIILLFSGHGFAAPNSLFYLVPYDTGHDPRPRPNDIRDYLNGSANSFQKQLAGDLVKNSISSAELASWIGNIDARKFLILIDACYAGAVVTTKNEFRPGPMGDPGFGQLAYDKGAIVLCSTQAESISVANFHGNNGLLTSALLDDHALLALRQTADFSTWLKISMSKIPIIYQTYYAHKNDEGYQLPQLYDFSDKLSSAK